MITVKDARKVVEYESLLFKRCLDKGEFVNSLQHAALMLNSLSVPLLPHEYSEIETKCVTELDHLSKWLTMESHNKVDLNPYYEALQYCPNATARMYLLITVGSVLCRHSNNSEIIGDIEWTISCIQHPLQSFYIRIHFSRLLHDVYTPKIPSSLLIDNFISLHLVWCRIRYHLPFKDTHATIRHALQPLIQSSLDWLAQHITYPDSILKQSIYAKDSLSQTTIALSLIRLFPSIAESSSFLERVAHFENSVDVPYILSAYFNRVEEYLYYSSVHSVEAKTDVYHVWLESLLQFFSDSNFGAISTIKISTSFLSLSVAYSTDDDVLSIISRVDDHVQTSIKNNSFVINALSMELVVLLLVKAICLCGNLSLLFTNQSFQSLSTLLSAYKEYLFAHVIQGLKEPTSLQERHTTGQSNLQNRDNFMTVFSFFVTEIDSDKQSSYIDCTISLIHEIRPTAPQYVNILEDIFTSIKSKECLVASLLPVLISKWISYLYSSPMEPKVIENIFTSINMLEKAQMHIFCVKLSLQALLCIDNLTNIDFSSQGDLFIDKIANSLSLVEPQYRLDCYLQVIATLTHIKQILIENFVNNMTTSALELFVTPREQSSAIIACSRLYVNSNEQRKLLSCIKKALKTLGQCGKDESSLILDVVNHIVYYQHKGILQVEYGMVEDCINRVESIDDNVRRYRDNINNIVTKWTRI